MKRITTSLWRQALCILVVLLIFTASSYAHRSGCHRWHSCESDRGTYICGDLGYCSGCTDNQFCRGGQPVSYQEKPQSLNKAIATASEPRASAPGIASEGQVVGISDGDTIKVLVDGKETKIRLAEIDAPEKKQPFGAKSKQSLSELCFDKRAEVKPQAIDRYGRTVARVRCAGVDASAEQVRRGLAWVYDQYVKDKGLYAIQDEARAGHRGLWVDHNPIPPWEWRKRGN